MAGDPRRLPADFVAGRAETAAASAASPAEPRHAATVVLLRDGTAGIEAYLLQRAGSMAFAAGMTVFPGGSVDPQDTRPETGEHWIGPRPDEWCGPLAADPPLARALVCAAVRETFEESGVLLAGPDDRSVADVSDPTWEDDRQALLGHRESLSGVLARRQLKLRADLLRPWAHWITPEVEPRRYDTRFFVAALPAGQATRDVGGEADRTSWMRPEEALERVSEGRMAMLPPTSFTLAELAEFADVAAVLAAATKRDIQPVLPRIVVTQDQVRVLLPHDPGYSNEESTEHEEGTP